MLVTQFTNVFCVFYCGIHMFENWCNFSWKALILFCFWYLCASIFTCFGRLLYVLDVKAYHCWIEQMYSMFRVGEKPLNYWRGLDWTMPLSKSVLQIHWLPMYCAVFLSYFENESKINLRNPCPKPTSFPWWHLHFSWFSRNFLMKPRIHGKQ